MMIKFIKTHKCKKNLETLYLSTINGGALWAVSSPARKFDT